MPHLGDYSTRASPGDGITPVPLSREPLATEGEATPGPDDFNPFEELEAREQLEAAKRTTETALPDKGRGSAPMPGAALPEERDRRDREPAPLPLLEGW